MINGGGEQCMRRGRGSNCGSAGSEMTVRQWIGRAERVVDRVESLHIFRQILGFVDVAHAQSVILHNIRPSCFVLSTLNRVTFLDSSSSGGGGTGGSVGGGSSTHSSSDRSTGSRLNVASDNGLGDIDDDYDESSPGLNSLETTRQRHQHHLREHLRGLGRGSGSGSGAGGLDGGVSRDQRPRPEHVGSFGPQDGGRRGADERAGLGLGAATVAGGGAVAVVNGRRGEVGYQFKGRGESNLTRWEWEQVRERSERATRVGLGSEPSFLSSEDDDDDDDDDGEDDEEEEDDDEDEDDEEDEEGGHERWEAPGSRFDTSGVESRSQSSYEQQQSSESAASPPLRENKFPRKQAFLREQMWYTSPEELAGGTGSFASDIYCLGVLLFELFCTFATEAEHARAMADLRHRILPPKFHSERSKEAAFCLWLLHPDPTSRPKAREIIRCELLSDAEEALAEREAAISLDAKVAEIDMLHEFLLEMLEDKQNSVQKLSRDVSRLTFDTEEVEMRRSSSRQKRTPSLGRRAGKEGGARVATAGFGGNEMVAPCRAGILGKRARWEGYQHGSSDRGEEGARPSSGNVHDGTSLKSARLMRNFMALEKVYFDMRWKDDVPATTTTRMDGSLSGSRDIGTSNILPAITGSNARNFQQQRQQSRQQQQKPGGGSGEANDWLGGFFDSFCRYARHSQFEVKATVRHGDLLNTANMVCSLSFDRDEDYFATAGVSKRIKIFECDSVLNEHGEIHYPVVEMATQSKLSSVCWNSYIKSYVASSDYDGTVQLWDVSTRQPVMTYREHDKRAWSVDFSRSDPMKLASGSDDASVKLWSINQEASVGTIRTKSNVCCVQFPSDSSNLLVFGSADYKIYCYDLRTTRVPLGILSGHNKAVSYLRFVDPTTIVSASTDSTLKLWDLTQVNTNHGVNAACSLTYSGHLNERNYVGLSVANGYIACGSEKNSVFAYHKSLPMPLASHRFGELDPITGQETEDNYGQFVSSVCWRGKTQQLIAANSMGTIKVLELV